MFMSSGHWQNTGLAKWINDNLYNYNPKDEKSMSPPKWHDVQNGVPMNAHRESICGFPCRLILVNDGTTPLNVGQYEPTPGNTKDMGVFNFNNDKDNTDTLGFDTDIFPYCASYEVTANSDTSAGAFMSYEQGIHSESEHEANGAITVQADNICHRHNTIINEIKGNTENGISVGVRQGNGTYNVEIVVSNANQDNYQERTLLINLPTALRRNGDAIDRMYWDDNDKHYYIEQWVDPNTGNALTNPNVIASGIVKKLEFKHYTGKFSVDVRNLSPSYMKVTVPYLDVPSDYVYREEDEVAYFKESFELRFPDEDDVGSDYGFIDINGDKSMGLKRLIDWVDKSTDEEFVRDFEQYFHKQYTLRYYLLVIVLG